MTSQRLRRLSLCHCQRHRGPSSLPLRLLRPPLQSTRRLRQPHRRCLRSCRRCDIGSARLTGSFSKSHRSASPPVALAWLVLQPNANARFCCLITWWIAAVAARLLTC